MHKGDVTVIVACPNCYEGDHVLSVDYNSELTLSAYRGIAECSSCENKFLITAYVDMKNITKTNKSLKECQQCGLVFIKDFRPSDEKLGKGKFCSASCKGKAASAMQND
jgi:hypothetical protein